MWKYLYVCKLRTVDTTGEEAARSARRLTVRTELDRLAKDACASKTGRSNCGYLGHKYMRVASTAGYTQTQSSGVL